MIKKFKKFAKVESEVKSEYIKNLVKIQKGKHIKIGAIEDFKKRYRLK